MDQSTGTDATILTLVRAGIEPRVAYETIWPGAKPYAFDVFLEVVRALEIADATAAPPEQLPAELEAVVEDLAFARSQIMKAIQAQAEVGNDAGDADRFDSGPHVALCKNADALLKYQSARQERQVHLLNLRVARERAAIELRQLHEGTYQ